MATRKVFAHNLFCSWTSIKFNIRKTGIYSQNNGVKEIPDVIFKIVALCIT